MEQAGRGRSFEAGQARVAVELVQAREQRRRLIAQGDLKLPALEGIKAATETDIDELYARQSRFVLGGLLDHLRGLSLWNPAVDVDTLRLAREAGLLP